MKTQTLNQNTGTNLVDRDAMILHEQLALKRLKELELKPRRSLKWRWNWRWSWLWQAPRTVLVALFRKAELARQIAPGQAPVEWHEAEDAKFRRATQML